MIVVKEVEKTGWPLPGPQHFIRKRRRRAAGDRQPHPSAHLPAGAGSANGPGSADRPRAAAHTDHGRTEPDRKRPDATAAVQATSPGVLQMHRWPSVRVRGGRPAARPDLEHRTATDAWAAPK